MAGLRLAFRGAPDAVLAAVGSAAASLGFSVAATGPASLSVRKGNLFLSVLAGAFVAYCNFQVVVEASPEGVVQVSIHRNTPWWTGVIGVSRVKTKAKELADSASRMLSGSGIAFLGSSEF